MPLSLEGTFTLQQVGKPARRAELLQARRCRSRKFLKHCSQNTRSSGKEGALEVQGQPGRLAAHREAPLGAALPPARGREAAGKGQDSGHAVFLRDHGHGRGTTS